MDSPAVSLPERGDLQKPQRNAAAEVPASFAIAGGCPGADRRNLTGRSFAAFLLRRTGVPCQTAPAIAAAIVRPVSRCEIMRLRSWTQLVPQGWMANALPFGNRREKLSFLPEHSHRS